LSTFILLHGAYQGGWSWNHVAAELRRAGHVVFAPSLDGCAERGASLRPGITTETHGEEIARLMHFEDIKDAVLVGTSVGGMVVCNAAERAPERVGRVVFVDALALLNGEKLNDFVNRKSSMPDEVSAMPTQENLKNRILVSLPQPILDWTLERMAPHPISPMEHPVHLDRFWQMKWDATVIYCKTSPHPGIDIQRRTAELLGAKWLELDAGHYPMQSHPVELAKLIMT
jgi:pimeloyl-ACP methyl ester carboxylesterase